MRKRVVRRLAVLAAVLAAALLWLFRGGRNESAGPAVPSATSQERVERAATPPTPGAEEAPGERVVELPGGGVLRVEGKVTGVAGLRTAFEGRTAAALRVEDRVPWAHVEWVLGTLRDTGVRDVRFDLTRGSAAAVLDSAYWERDARRLPGGHLAGEIAVIDEDIAIADLAAHVARERDRIVAAYAWQPIGLLYPDPHAPFASVVPALRAFADAEVELELACWGLRDDTGKILPPVPELVPNAAIWPHCGCRSVEFAAVELPVADMGDLDNDTDLHERIVLNLDRDGHLLYRGGELNLEDLAAVLAKRAEAYEVKMRRQGESAFEALPQGGRVSQLYVLIRADRKLPFRQVAWILHVLAEQGLYKVQFAVRRAPAASEPGPCVGGLDGKLQAFLPTAHLPEIVSHPSEVWPIHVHVQDDRFGFGVTRTADPGGITPYLRQKATETPEYLSAVVVLHVSPGATHERVVTAVNEVHRALLSKIDFAGIPPPDATTRLAKPLPR